jgi:hypothetical protein
LGGVGIFQNQNLRGMKSKQGILTEGEGSVQLTSSIRKLVFEKSENKTLNIERS